MSNQSAQSLASVQRAVDRLVNAKEHERERALRQLATSLLQHYNHDIKRDTVSELFSLELPLQIQRFSAVWLLRALVDSNAVLDFGNTHRQTAALFDRVFRNDIYHIIKINEKEQTFEKIQSLTDYATGTIHKVRELSRNIGNLSRLNQNHRDFQKLFNDKRTSPFLIPLFPRHLVKHEITNLFERIDSYVNSIEDPIIAYEVACKACDDYEKDAKNHGTRDASEILGCIARCLKSAVKDHFIIQEKRERPHLVFLPTEKRYPLEQHGVKIIFKIKIKNEGSGPARNLSLEAVALDSPLQLTTLPTVLDTIQADDAIVVDISATVLKPCLQADLIAEFSWIRLGKKITKEVEFTIFAQKADVDWERVEISSPYSLEPIITGDDLIGRKDQLNSLLRLANQTVSSAFIFGQRRVGKTSLANVLAEKLRNVKDIDWIVIQKGSGDYMSSDPKSTLRKLGEELVSEMQEQNLGLENLSFDFSTGLSPLSSTINKALKRKNLRLLFILDEFDELPSELLRRTDLSAALFLPLREISTKTGCGFILIGGENMQRIMNDQGDRLNKFTPFQVDYFDKYNDWRDFAELIRKPVQDWLTISDQALNALFSYSAGNPYFAKLLANELFVNMISLRHSNASEDDMHTAFLSAAAKIGANSFTHFWTDDIAQDENAEKIRLERRSVLIGTGYSFRKGRCTISEESILNEVKRSIGISIGEEIAKNILHDFISRGVLIEDKGYITARIPLFKSWLKDRGVSTLLADIREKNYMSARLKDEELIRVTDEQIFEVARHLGRYRGQKIESAKVRIWLDQFDTPEDQRLMYILLSKVNVYHEDRIRSKMHEAFRIVTRNMRTVVGPRERVRRNIVVSHLDTTIGKSGSEYCKLFKDENRIWFESVMSLDVFRQRLDKEHDFQRLVLIDDFSGTGHTIVEGLDRNLKILRKANDLNVQIIVIVIVGFEEARENIERFVEDNDLDAVIHFCDELGEGDKAFSPMSHTFPNTTQRDRAKQIAEAKGVQLERNQPLGFGGMEASIAFYQSCPNNTLPILWSDHKGWIPLFPRF